MPKIKKTASDKEKELVNIIADAKKKLSKLQEKQKIDIGELAYKHGLNKFDLTALDNAFKKISLELAEA
ncbi:hypothetical protein [Legionella drozanskii]|uniref:Uncharacterized protein n=1 Tax=Legionella drozanskii LLAP-1 TaxID=1212489 RepID=A0A0W0SWD0_9GAMM|nr:hypothetical protein [Legionella drozanskii]KTC87640.1 hypothetical protein Ldro_1259 [Legionella drozanskii LLAP-1]